MRTSKRFFCLEGIDGCGKSTQLKLLSGYLESKGFDVLSLREPGGSEISERIRSLLLDARYKGVMDPKTELLLYNSARAQVIAEKIRPALEAGKVVLADRFAWSTLAYQGYGRGIDPRTVLALSQIACGECVPELTIVLDLTVEESRRRMATEGRTPDRLESEKAEFFERVRNGYRKIAVDFPNEVALVDAMRNVQEIQSALRRKVDARLKFA